jgi:transaldolase / glucose-6-phosphate isomerase
MATAPTTNPLVDVLRLGQSIWYDNIRRSLLTSGELDRLVDEGLRGVTSNPAIFSKAIAGSTDYADAIAAIPAGDARDAKEVYEALAIRDIQDAADALRPVYDESGRRDGYVSLEVSPELADDSEATVAEAMRLWNAVDRENLLVKVPATPAGIPAIRALIANGINVNVTLLFATSAYEQVAEAYISGLEDYAMSGGDVSRVASVASFFISRIDSAVDPLVPDHLKGRVAIANAKVTYQRYRQLYASDRWQALAAQGAQTQRLLWASTSTKNPAYRDVVYVEELIGADTVNTVPPATFDAFRDHGVARPSLEEDAEDAYDTLGQVAASGVDLGAVTDTLLDEAVAAFADAFAALLGAVAAAVSGGGTTHIARQSARLPRAIRADVDATIAEWGESGKVARLWGLDASVWTGADESSWLGWLRIADDQLAHLDQLEEIARDVRTTGFGHALLLGMGGSSLFPELLSLTFAPGAGHPALHILDSTDPTQVQAALDAIDVTDTIFIVSSKSGSTLEPNIFKQFFFAKAAEALGEEEAAKRFIAVTDPGSKVEALAAAAGFRHIAHGVKQIGGRYSALSNFGMVPGAVMGAPVHELLDSAHGMAQACAGCVPAQDNPGLALGAVIGVCVNHGRDKLTLVASPGIHDLGAWLEQLVAESTGKVGEGVIPVDREPLGAPEAYGDDRLFVSVALAAEGHPAALDAIESAGHPVVRITIDEAVDLGGEVFRWELATAVAGAVIGINPFDQPDVEASKVVTRELTAAYEQSGSLPPEEPIYSGEGVRLFTDERNAAQLGEHGSLEAYLRAHLGRAGAGDYVALLAYVPMTEAHEAVLTEMRTRIRDAKRTATCVGFGPRFLHSTGQAYKGGPNSGVFLQITCDDPADVPVPEQQYSFGVVKAAQARGDFAVLADRGRRALRIHLNDADAGLALLRDTVASILNSERNL